jgi:hypothetical protein
LKWQDYRVGPKVCRKQADEKKGAVMNKQEAMVAAKEQSRG